MSMPGSIFSSEERSSILHFLPLKSDLHYSFALLILALFTVYSCQCFTRIRQITLSSRSGSNISWILHLIILALFQLSLCALKYISHVSCLRHIFTDLWETEITHLLVKQVPLGVFSSCCDKAWNINFMNAKKNVVDCNKVSFSLFWIWNMIFVLVLYLAFEYNTSLCFWV